MPMNETDRIDAAAIKTILTVSKAEMQRRL
jgi:hypothetical protein